MYPSSHSPKALSSRWSVSFVTFSWLLGAPSARRTSGPTAHTGLGDEGGVGGPPEQVCPSSQIVFSMVARETLEREEGHIVMFLTRLLESISGCEIAHMVPRAGTLVPISRKCEQLHTRCFPGFSQHRRCVIALGPPLASHTPARRGAPQSSQEAFAGRVTPPQPRRRPRGQPPASRDRLRAWEGPRRGGGLRDQPSKSSRMSARSAV